MANQYANTMAFLALVHFLVEEKGYKREKAIEEAAKKIKAESK